MIRAVRGAITVEQDSPEAIQTAVAALIEAVLTRNRIQPESILSLFFTMTPDLRSLNPAQAIRQARHDWHAVPMLCAQELETDGAMAACIRILMHWQPQPGMDDIQPVAAYLGKAGELRPDLS